jgi:hypothetical protein
VSSPGKFSKKCCIMVDFNRIELIYTISMFLFTILDILYLGVRSFNVAAAEVVRSLGPRKNGNSPVHVEKSGFQLFKKIQIYKSNLFKICWTFFFKTSRPD